MCTVAGLSCSIIYMPNKSNGTLWARRQHLKCPPVSGIPALKKCYFAWELRCEVRFVIMSNNCLLNIIGSKFYSDMS